MSTSLRFTLEHYNFRKGVFYGNVVTREQCELKTLVSKLAPWIHPDDLSELLDKVGEETRNLLRQGYRISLSDFGTMEPFIEGTFFNENDSFDPMRHSLQVRVNTGGKLRNLDRDRSARVKKVKGIRRS